MRVLFISANIEKMNILPLPLGLNGVAVATRNAGHDVRLLDLMIERDGMQALKNAVESFVPDVIGVSVRNIDSQVMNSPVLLLDQAREAVRTCRFISPVPIVVGGAGYSVFPDSALAYLEADMGIQGEGEVAFPDLLSRMRRGKDFAKTPGLYVHGSGLQGKRRFAGNLDDLPLPDETLWPTPAEGENPFDIPVQTRRGCPMNCNYCSTAAIEGCKVRKRNPEHVVENMARHVARGYRQFYFVDNTFNMPLTYAKDLCRKMIERKLDISWRCIFYPGRIDEELVGLMVRAGCREVSLGFESGCDRILQIMNKRFDTASIRRTVELLRTGGIRQMGFLMLGGPGETKTSVEKSLDFASSLNLESMKVTIGIRIYPHTALSDMAVAEGLIAPNDHLLFPRFYMVRHLEEWIHQTVRSRMNSHPEWIA